MGLYPGTGVRFGTTFISRRAPSASAARDTESIVMVGLVESSKEWTAIRLVPILRAISKGKNARECFCRVGNIHASHCVTLRCKPTCWEPAARQRPEQDRLVPSPRRPAWTAWAPQYLRPAAWMYTDAPMNRVKEMPIQDPMLEEIVRRLVDDCQPERVYLFGSRARGNAGADSDYDIMVVVAQSDQPAYRRAQRAHTLIWDLGAAADILVWTRDAFDSRVHLRASLPATITREGQLLYAA